jgi:hypothetical protein
MPKRTHDQLYELSEIDSRSRQQQCHELAKTMQTRRDQGDRTTFFLDETDQDLTYIAFDTTGPHYTIWTVRPPPGSSRGTTSSPSLYTGTRHTVAALALVLFDQVAFAQALSGQVVAVTELDRTSLFSEQYHVDQGQTRRRVLEQVQQTLARVRPAPTSLSGVVFGTYGLFLTIARLMSTADLAHLGTTSKQLNGFLLRYLCSEGPLHISAIVDRAGRWVTKMEPYRDALRSVYGVKTQAELQALPTTLQRLTFDSRFDDEDLPLAFPQSLQTLKVNSYNRTFEAGVLPATLTDLSLGEYYNQPLLHLPDSVQRLSWGKRFTHLTDIRWPKSLHTLKSGSALDLTKSLPDGLTTVSCGFCELTPGWLPETVRQLELVQHSYNRGDRRLGQYMMPWKIPLATLPSELQSLTVSVGAGGDMRDPEIAPGALPTTLQSLTLSTAGDTLRFAKGVLPSTLRDLVLIRTAIPREYYPRGMTLTYIERTSRQTVATSRIL